MASQNANRQIDGLYVHNTAGSLNLIVGRKLKPRCQRTYPLFDVALPAHRCMAPSAGVRSPIDLGTIMANAYGRFIIAPAHQPSPYNFTCATITLLNCMIPSDLVNSEGRLVAFCKNAGLHLRYTHLNNSEEVIDALDDFGTAFFGFVYLRESTESIFTSS